MKLHNEHNTFMLVSEEKVDQINTYVNYLQVLVYSKSYITKSCPVQLFMMEKMNIKSPEIRMGAFFKRTYKICVQVVKIQGKKV